MEIALVMEYSTCSKNEIVYPILKKVAEANGHTVTNYGQFNAEDNRQTYIQNSFFISALLESGAAYFVVTGCGTGEGAVIAANAMPGVVCGHVSECVSSYLFTQVNNGNCMALPFAYNWGWAGEINLEYIFEKLFIQEPGGGYPASSAKSEQENAARTNKLKSYTQRPLTEVLASLDDEDLIERCKAGFAGVRYELFKEKCKKPEVLAAVDAILAK